MEEKTIGQVLQTAREEQNLSLSDTERLSKIKKRYLRYLENDEFEEIPGHAQARNLLRRYAEFLELDVEVILDAYDSDTSLTVYEVETKDARKGRMSRRRKSKRKKNFLPIFYLLLLSLVILSFVIYTIWSYNQKNQFDKESASSTYQVTSSSSSSASASEEMIPTLRFYAARLGVPLSGGRSG